MVGVKERIPYNCRMAYKREAGGDLKFYACKRTILLLFSFKDHFLFTGGDLKFYACKRTILFVVFF